MNDIGSVVDVGCGDWSFSRLLDLRGISYLGLDVGPNIVANNNRAFGSDTCKFELMPESPALVPYCSSNSPNINGIVRAFPDFRPVVVKSSVGTNPVPRAQNSLRHSHRLA